MFVMAGFSSGSYNSHHQTMVQSSLVKGAGFCNGSIFGTEYGTAIRGTDKMTESELQATIADYVATAAERLEDR